MEETFHRLAQDASREQTHEIKLEPSALDPGETHHATGKPGIIILENDPV